MIAQELYRIAYNKPILTEAEENDNLPDDDIDTMTNAAWARMQKLLNAN